MLEFIMANSYYLIAIFLLLLGSAFFSSSETSMTALSRAKMHRLKQEGDKRAKHVEQLRDKKDLLLGSILIGNNLVNILASALVTKFFLDLFGDNGVALATIFMTIILVIFGEIIPKTYALYHANHLGLHYARLLRIVVFLFSPFAQLARFICLKIFVVFSDSCFC